jgi:DNA-binding transcriptional ArsR family regulator
MQVGTKSQSGNFSNGEIDNLTSMRLSAEPWRWRAAVLKADLTPGTKVAAIALIEFINRKSGRTFASHQTIAETCGMTERGVRAAIAALKKAGLIRVVRRGRMQTNLMYLDIPVTGMAVQSDRHDGDRVTGTAMPPNLREEPLRDNLPDRPSLELPVEEAAGIVSFDEGRSKTPTETTDKPVGPAFSEHGAYCRITAAAVRLLRFDSCPKLPDGRYLDRAIWDAIPAERRSCMVQRAMKGRLMTSEVAEVVRGLALAQAYQRAA